RSCLSAPATPPLPPLPLHDALPISSYPIVLLRPPYEGRDLRSALPDLGTAAAQPGSVVGVQLSRSPVDPGALRALVIDLSKRARSEEHTSELQSRENLVCRLLLEKK